MLQVIVLETWAKWISCLNICQTATTAPRSFEMSGCVLSLCLGHPWILAKSGHIKKVTISSHKIYIYIYKVDTGHISKKILKQYLMYKKFILKFHIFSKNPRFASSTSPSRWCCWWTCCVNASAVAAAPLAAPACRRSRHSRCSRRMISSRQWEGES